MKKRIAVSVSNDLGTDQRVRKQCQSMHDAGYELHLIGRQLADSPEVLRPYKVKRFRLFFNKKAAFYAELNLRLFLRLLFIRVDLFYANDLDTLPANALAAWLRRKPLVYDSHEFFTEVPEIQGRPMVKNVWSRLEGLCIKRADMVLTVNASIADLLCNAYSLPEVLVVRNVPDAKAGIEPASRADLGLPEGVPLLILQGSGINIDRGAEELLEAIALTDGLVLIIIGSGDAIEGLKHRATAPDLCDKVIFKPRMPYAAMMQYTALADLGLSLDKDTNINYRYSLPNKVFDYVAAGIPMLVSDLVEVRRFVEEHDLGVVSSSHDPEQLASLLQRTLNDVPALQRFRKNASSIAPHLHWEHEYAGVINKINVLLGSKV